MDLPRVGVAGGGPQSVWSLLGHTGAPVSDSSSEAWTSRTEEPLTPDLRKSPSLHDAQVFQPPILPHLKPMVFHIGWPVILQRENGGRCAYKVI